MLLRRLELGNFRGIRRAAIDLDETTAIIGENGSGKSTLLDALTICLGGRDDAVRLEPRDFHRDEHGVPAGALRISLTYEGVDDTSSASPPGEFDGLAEVDGGHRVVRLHVRGVLVPGAPAALAEWAFGDDPARATSQTHPGVLAAWRRAHPVLRLRANRYVEQNPRGDAPSPPLAEKDPVASDIERQIRFVYDRLTGADDVPADELRHSLAAAEAYLDQYAHLPSPSVIRRVAGDLAEAPMRSGRNPQALLSSIKQGAGLRGLALVALIGAMLEAEHRQGFVPGSRPLLLLEDAEAHLHPLTLSAMWELIATLRAQKVLTTNSGELLASVPLRSIRRITSDRHGTVVHRVDTDRYRLDDLRRIAYHVRVNRAGAFFARCWLLVEGETEAWLLPELAQVLGYDFPAEGIRCVEYAQCGVRPLIRLASELGLEWHLLSDGDAAGHNYSRAAAEFLHGRAIDDRVTMLEEADIEHCLYAHGYRFVYESLAGPAPATGRARPARERAWRVIDRAIRAHSKPGVALAIVEAANAPEAPAVPAQLRRVVGKVVGLARGSPPW
jgi:putative ATP-dependent endonuclease of OLD family